MKLLLLLVSLFLFSTVTSAETPDEIEGVWVPDVERSIELMKANMEDVDVKFMKTRYLPNLKRVIEESQFITISGKREYKADISFKEMRGENIVMIISGGASTNSPELEITFIPKGDGKYIMKSLNEADGSGNILWQKQP